MSSRDGRSRIHTNLTVSQTSGENCSLLLNEQFRSDRRSISRYRYHQVGLAAEVQLPSHRPIGRAGFACLTAGGRLESHDCNTGIGEHCVHSNGLHRRNTRVVKPGKSSPGYFRNRRSPHCKSRISLLSRSCQCRVLYVRLLRRGVAVRCVAAHFATKSTWLGSWSQPDKRNFHFCRGPKH